MLRRLPSDVAAADVYSSDLAHLNQLTPTAQAVLLMHYVDGQPYEQISAALDIDAANARKIAERARKQLRDTVNEDLQGRGPMSDDDIALRTQLRQFSIRGRVIGAQQLTEHVAATLAASDTSSRAPRSRWLMAAAAIGLCGAGVVGIALTKSGTGSLPAADPPAMGALGNDDGGPAHDLDDDGVIASTTIISPQSCSPVTFTFPANIGNTKLDVTTATLDRTGAGVFLTPTLTISRVGTAPEASSPTGIIDELVVTDIGTVTVHPARSGTVGPRAYGTLPTSDEDIDDLSNVTSSCDQWGIAAHTESVTIDDLVAFLERVTIAS